MNHKGTAVITGASTAIGGAFADQLARRGYDLILVAEDRPGLLSAAAKLTDRTGRSVEVFDGDLLLPADLDRIEHALRLDASITLFVNHHGLIGKAEVGAAIAMGVTVPTRMAYALASGFKARGTGTVINLVSVTDLLQDLPMSNEAAIESASSAFVLSLSRALAQQFGVAGVRVQTVLYTCPTENSLHLRDSASATVEAAMRGLDFGETVTLPGNIDRAAWNILEAAWVGLSTCVDTQSEMFLPLHLLH